MLNGLLVIASPVLENLQPVLDRLLISRISPRLTVSWTVSYLKRTASKVRDEPELHFWETNKMCNALLSCAKH